MPFTTIALDTLIEPKASKPPMAAGKNVTDEGQGSETNGTDKLSDRKNHWTQISPALYATPEPTPLPDSPTSFAPSPFIVNHKRRGPRLSKVHSEDEAAIHQAIAGEKTIEIVKSLEAEDIDSCRIVNGVDNGHEDVEDTSTKVVVNGEAGHDTTVEQDSEMDDFFDPRDSLSVISSSTDGESSFRLERPVNLNASASEFYDAWEELASENGSQTASNDVEAELRELRMSLLVEMEKRKHAEEHINDMQNRWRKICQQLSLVGLNIPEDPKMLEDQSSDDLGEELSHQINVLRSVSNSIGREEAKAEVEAEMKVQLEAKNFEIARLVDRLRYSEAVNQEMSQRNQEAIETMRGARQRRKTRERWIWGSIAAAVTLGSAALAWSYLPTAKGSSDAYRPPSHTSESSTAVHPSDTKKFSL